MQRLFVTGTDTGVGKTRIAAALLLALAATGKRVAGMKPVASGCARTGSGLRNDDALALQAAATVRTSYADVNPYAFEPAIAPHIAADEAGCNVDFEVLDRAYERLCAHSDAIIVEGAGGWLAPLDRSSTFADLAARWRMDVILVIGLRLGCLNHALLSVESIQRRQSRLAGWVGNLVDPDFQRHQQNLATLESRIAAPCLATFGYLPESSAADFARILAPKLSELDR